MNERSVDISTYEEDERAKLAKALEKEADKLQGVRREQFIDSRSLCGSCQWADIKRRASQNHRVIRCGQSGQTVPDDIVECSDYRTFNSLSLEQMARIAYMIDTRDHLKDGYR